MNAKTSRRLSPVLSSSKTLCASLPLVLAAFVAQGCGNGLDQVEPNTTGAAGSTAPGSPSSAPATTTGSAETGSAETGSAETGSAETGSAETGSAETGSAETGSAETGSPEQGPGEEGKTTGTDSTKTDETKTNDSSSTDSSSTDSSSTDSSSSDSTGTTEEEKPAPDEKGDDKVALEWYETGVDAQLIGLATPSKDEAWVGGTDSTMLHTEDGGKTWKRVLVSSDAADAKLQFRDVEVTRFGSIYALAAGEGGASRIYRSRDDGDNWTEQFKAEEEKAFINCMDFGSSSNGFVYGDSIDKKHYILRTKDGRKWERVDTENLPEAQENEGGFSSSGTCAVATDRRTFLAATAGGKTARVLKSTDRGENWKAFDVPLTTGETFRGLTSLVMWSKDEGLVFATDLEGEKVDEAIAYTKDGGETWEKRDFVGPKLGFFGGAANEDGSFIIGVGPSGMHYSTDKGVSWTEVSRKNLWGVSFADDKTAYAVGEKGTVAKITLK